MGTGPVADLERERVRATLVIGLIAAILGLRVWEHPLPEPFRWAPVASGALLLYWGLYAGAAAYGISTDLFDRDFCDKVLWFAHLSFRFALAVTLIMGAWTLLPVFNIRWSYSAVGVVTAVPLAWMEARDVYRSHDRVGYAKKSLRTWIALAMLLSPLFVLDYL